MSYTVAMVNHGAPELERAKGIEPSYAAWEAAVLPLNYARDLKYLSNFSARRARIWQKRQIYLLTTTISAKKATLQIVPVMGSFNAKKPLRYPV